MMSPDELSEIDDVRFERRLHSRSETIRFLVKKGIETISGRLVDNADMLGAGSES
jgi:metal-responsive CopG/Arc/MetJ family transcriptional regulator